MHNKHKNKLNLIEGQQTVTLIRKEDGQKETVSIERAEPQINSGKYYYVDLTPPQFDDKQLKNLQDKVNNLITAIVVNYKTRDLIQSSITAFRQFYPQLLLIIIDNSSYDASSEWIYQFAKKDNNTICLFNNYNLHHGPSLDTGIRISKTDLIFTFDSDTTITKAGLLEYMVSKIPNCEWYGMSIIDAVNKSGFDVVNGQIKYINPRCALINKNIYLRFKPFVKHGAPCIDAMTDLYDKKQDNLLINFNYWAYINHECRGTVTRTGGYHLKDL